MTRFLYLAYCGAALPSIAQHHADVWQFGDDAGITFQNCTPIVLTNGANEGFEGCSSICDANGQLLFYTNSETVWNSAHAPMPNGTLVPGGASLSQVIIVRQPLSDSLYWIFTTQIQATASTDARYHVVDLSLAGGLGDVALANANLYPGTITEHVSATLHANGVDIWILFHAYPSNEFLAYLLTSSGLNTTPVISAVGPPFATCPSNMNARGEMKLSIAGDRLALTGNGVGPDDSTNHLVLFDFDNATGVVSDPLVLPYCRGDFGVSFSPDGSKLYAATWKAFAFTAADTNLIVQFDLSSADSATIVASRQGVQSTSITEPFGSLQLAPDGRIYVARQGSGSLGMINDPDQPAPSCGYVHNGLFLNGRTCRFGLNNHLQYVTCGSISTGAGSPVPDPFTVGPNPVTDLLTIGTHSPCAVQGGYTLLDQAGRTVRSGPVPDDGVLDLRTLTPGVYQLFLRSAQGLSPQRILKL